MELKDLLNNQDWDKGSLDPKEAFKKQGLSALIRLGRYYNQSLLINASFLLGTIILFAVYQTAEMLAATAVIAGCFVTVLFRSYKLVSGYRMIDFSQDISTVIQETLSLDEKVNHSIRRLSSMIFTCSFLGGFFAGLFINGWTFEEIAEKPVILLVVSLLSVGVYFLSSTGGMKKYSKKVSPGYYQVKNELKTVLQDLQRDES